MNDPLDYRGLPVLALGVDVPDVRECYGCLGCPQHGGDHDHQWAVVHVGKELTIRCRVCGGRCCSTLHDWQTGRNPCIGLRHHADFHIYRDGGLEPVGGRWVRG